MTKLQRIRKEYGSFRKAVTYYASLGCGKNATARHLNIGIKYFRKYCARFNLEDAFPQRAEMNAECRGGRPDIAKHNRHIKSHKALSDGALLDWVAQCETTREFNRKSPHSASTVSRHFGSWPEAKRRADARAAARRVELDAEATINGTFGRVLEIDYMQGAAVMETQRGIMIVPLNP